MMERNPLAKINNKGKAHPTAVIASPVGRKVKSLKIGDNYNLRSGTVIYRGVSIGENFQTGHHAVIREENRIGDNVSIGVNSYLGPGNIIGNNVKIHTNCFIEGCQISNEVIIAPGAVLTNDPYPPCKKCVRLVGGAKIGRKTVIGANSTVLPGVVIGENCLVGAGSVVTKNIPRGVVVVGNPAKIIKDVNEIKHPHK